MSEKPVRVWKDLDRYELERCYRELCPLDPLLSSFASVTWTADRWLEKLLGLPHCPSTPPLSVSYLHKQPKSILQFYCESYSFDPDPGWTRLQLLVFLINHLGLDAQELQWWRMTRSQLLSDFDFPDSPRPMTKAYMIHQLWKKHTPQKRSLSPSLPPLRDMETPLEKQVLQTWIRQWLSVP